MKKFVITYIMVLILIQVFSKEIGLTFLYREIGSTINEVDRELNLVKFLLWLVIDITVVGLVGYMRLYDQTQYHSDLFLNSTEERRQLIVKLKELNQIIDMQKHTILHDNKNYVALLAVVFGQQEKDNRITPHLANENRARIESIVDLLDMVYTQDDQSTIYYCDFLKRFCEKKETLYNMPISLIIDKRFALPTLTSISLTMIIDELIRNSVKHAFKNVQNANILINVRENNSKIHLTVQDNGIGIPHNCLSESHKGLKIIRDLVTHAAGTIEIMNNNGSKFHITLKI